MKRFSILLIDDHAVLRDGLKFIAQQSNCVEVIAEAATAKAGIAAWREFRPDLTLLDLYLPDAPGLDVLQQIVAADSTAKVLILTTAEGDEEIHRAATLGAKGYLLKTERARDIIKAVESVCSGGDWWPAEIKRLVAERDAFTPLSARELEVLEMLAKGLPNKDIAGALSISIFTCKIHTRRIFQKMKVCDRTEAVIVGHQRGLIRLS